MSELVSEMDERIDKLLSAGLDKFTDFTEEFPLVVVVLEEYAGLMRILSSQDRVRGGKMMDRVAPNVEAAVLRLARESAKVGMRLVIVTQHASSEVLTTAVRSQLVNRISFAQGKIGLDMVHEDLPDDLRSSAPYFQPGEGSAELEGAPPVRFRGDFTDYQGFRALVRQAHELRQR